MKLSEARRKAGLTQTELARRAKVDQKTISKIENGLISEPSHAKVVRICQVLGTDPQSIDEFKVDGPTPWIRGRS